MTITNTAQSFAHDAAVAASDLATNLGSQAAELGSKAAELGSDAASSVAAAATTLAHTIGKKVPVVPSQRRSSPWRMFVLAGVALVGVLLVVKRRRSASAETSDPFVPAPTAAQPVDTTVASTNGQKTNAKSSVTSHDVGSS
jgi:hypothetical protein